MTKILAIDDIADNLILIEALLNVYIPDCEVYKALSGPEGILLAHSMNPDTILLDISMPEMDGFEVCQKLKEDAKTRSIPIIMLSALKVDLEYRIHGLEIGADAFLTKPLNESELVAMVKVMMRIKKAEDSLRNQNIELKQTLEVKTQEHRKDRVKLSNLEENYTRLFKNNHQVILLVNPLTGKVEDANPAACRFYGFDKNELLNVNFLDLCMDPQGYIYSKLDSALKQEIISFYIKQKPKDKSTKDVEASVVPVYIDDLKYAYIIIEDITQRIQSENQLRESENYYRNLFNSINDSIFIHEQEGNFINVNDAASRLLGYSVVELLNKKPSDIITTDSNQTRPGVVNELMRRKQIIFENTFLSIHGDEIPVEINSKLIEYKGRVATLSIARDITDRKRNEKRLEEAKIKAEESDKLKSAFLSNMSHEIRTPLNAIVGFSSLLASPNITQDQVSEYIEYINIGGESLINIVNDLLDISKIESGQMELRESDCYLNKMLFELSATFNHRKKREEREHIDLTVNIPDTGKEVITRTDAERLRQILSNLISNGLKFTEEGFVEIGYRLIDGKKIEFYVKDSGIGIVESKKGLIFDRFRKLYDNNDKLYAGTGLGLSISKSLVEMLGGEIWLDSVPEKGSTFYFTIPYIPVGQTVQNINSIIDPLAKYNWLGKSILIAEDEDINYFLIEEALVLTNVNIYRVKTGKQAIEFFQDENPRVDVILMDIKMPEMDGYEAMKRIKIMEKEFPIIAQTAYAMEGEKEQIMSSGFDDYISKPIRIKALLEKIHHYLK